MKNLITILTVIIILNMFVGCADAGHEERDTITEPQISTSETDNLFVSVSGTDNVPAFEKTAEGYPVVTILEDSGKKRYISFDQTEEVVYAPLCTEEYSLPHINYSSPPTNEIIDGLQIVNTNAVLYLDGYKLIVERNGEKVYFDMNAFMRGRAEIYHDVASDDETIVLNAFHEWDFWFYQQDSLVTFFFVYNDVRDNSSTAHLVQLDLNTLEIQAYTEFPDRSLWDAKVDGDTLYLLTTPSQIPEISTVYVLSYNNFEQLYHSEEVEIPNQRGYTNKLIIESETVFVEYYDSESGTNETMEIIATLGS